MAQKEVKQWITVNGKHVPIFEGESKSDAIVRAMDKGMERNPEMKKANDAVVEHSNKVAEKEKNKKEYELKKKDKEITDREAREKLRNQISKDNNEKEKQKAEQESKKESSFGKEINDKISNYRDKFLKGKSDKQIQEIKDNLEKSGKITGTSEQDHIALAAIRKEQEARKKTGQEGSSSKDKKVAEEGAKISRSFRDKYSTQIRKDLDTKEKQIAQHQAEVDKLNGKKNDRQTKIDDYNEKVLNRRYEERQKFSKAGDGSFIVDFDQIGGTMNSFKDLAKRKGFEVVRSDGESVTLRKSSASTKSSVADLRKQALAKGYSKEKIQGMSAQALKKLLQG